MNAPRYQWKPRAGFFTTPAIAGAILVQANGGFEAWAGDGRLGRSRPPMTPLRRF